MHCGGAGEADLSRDLVESLLDLCGVEECRVEASIDSRGRSSGRGWI